MMKIVVRSVAVVLAAVTLVSVNGHAAGAAAPAPVPALIVVLVVDQLRGDYVARYGYQWTKGLHRLVTRGAWFSRAAFPYANTVTCAGHATIATGAFPASHGIVGNSWFDKSAWQSVACAELATATGISYGVPVAGGGNGPDRLLIPTLADELRASSPGPTRVVTMSVKARSAVMLAGRRAESVTWYSPDAKGLVTSSFYTKEPVPFVAAFTRANPIEADFDTPWTRVLPVDQYRFQDDGPGEDPAAYWTSTFPHPFKGEVPEKDAWAAWESSPHSDRYLGRLAMAAVDALKMGQGAGTDFLGISFSALDLVGHDFGPKSHEVQDLMVRLDETIGLLLDHLDRTVGPDSYVVALSSDHGVALIPESSTVSGLDAGRLPGATVVKAAQTALQHALGAGEYKVRLQGTDLHVEPAVLERLRANPQAVEHIAKTIREVPGIAAVYAADALASAAAAGDRDARAALLGYRPGRSGDFIVFPRPHWFYGTPGAGGTSHGTPYGYDQDVPIVLFGAGIKAGEYLRAATPADIAPTLAFLTGVTLSRPDGRVLVEALAPRHAAPAK
jgi:predicted AlkP superfamily pyrophosphatase or phosphodiesterase